METKHAPGLNGEEKEGTYLSLLPNDLIKLLDFFYYFPLKIKVNSVSTYEDEPELFVDIFIIRSFYSGKNRDSVQTGIRLYEFIEFLSNPILSKIYPELNFENDSYGNMDYVQILILKDGLEIYISTALSTITIVYDDYETKMLLKKLKAIQTDANKYQIMSRDELIKKLEKYAY